MLVMPLASHVDRANADRWPPIAAADHQTTNATTLERVGAAIHVPQSQLTVERLDTTIRRLLENPLELDRLARGAAARARPHAADDIAKHILALVDHAAA